MTSELVSIAIGGYEDCHLVNQPTLQDAFEQVCEQLNYWLPPDEPNPHCTDKVSQFHQQKWLQACKLLENSVSFRKTGA